MLYQHNDETSQRIDVFKSRFPRIANPYVGVHVRRGDKVSKREGPFIPVSKYVKAISRICPDYKNVFVATDDYRVIEDFYVQLPHHEIYTFCEKRHRGHDPMDLFKSDPLEQDTEMIRLFTDIDVLVSGDSFISTPSDLSLTVHQLRHHNSYDVRQEAT